ncbi:hypothetical protein HYC85_020038 [Camellia sinensis]|uniref:Uncharacterized protein n=1 Tax=Camellia sinensis TaxID=4442 RepID=A0A7J7GSC4_CAMSI|nr:hypothetical protein HYC85_020038 [Camellia sinensis]
MAVEDEDGDIAIEFVPLEGDEEGLGSCLGSICSPYPLGNLDVSATERTMKARIRVMSKHWCLQQPDMLNDNKQGVHAQRHSTLQKQL